MCGITGGFNLDIQRAVDALAHRGPDASGLLTVGRIHFGHTRLSIIDLDSRSNQPFSYGAVTLVFNGEIWNYKTLRDELLALGCVFTTLGDTEVLAAALATWGINALLKLDGMFAIGWTTDGETLYLARDRFGEMPLHIAKQHPFCFGSELKALRALGARTASFDDIQPGHYAIVTPHGIRQCAYYDAPVRPCKADRAEASQRIFDLLERGTVNRRIADVPVCTLLSGGIDSAATAYFLAQNQPDITAYTAVYNPKSRDLQMARLVAAQLGIRLVEVKVPIPTTDDLRRVIRCIEMPYKAQVEIGWPCLKLAEAMRADGFRVTFSGEGSDELWASYGFAYHALKTQDWHAYRKTLFLSQSRKNFVRCNKIFMAHGVECRLPFLHYPLVEYALSLRQPAVQDGKTRPKAVMQDAFAGRLPDSVTRRPKVAFQDGMGIKDAIGRMLPHPERFYRAEYVTLYG